jgi:hypothetical protein
MRSPVASAPVAVLVLAWDETTPAARVLVEATEVSTSYADAVVALVPTGPQAKELSQEEFLPLAASRLLSELLAEPAAIEAAPSETEAVDSETAAAAAAAPLAEPDPAENPPAPATTTQAQTPITTGSPAPGPVAPLPLTAVAAALVRPALVWQQVRVLHLPAAPTLVWAGTANTPAAPYLGSSEPAAKPSPAAPALQTSAVAAALLVATETAASALAALRTPEPLALNPLPPTSEGSPAPTYLLEELPAAPDAESDAAPLPASSEPGPLAAASPIELSALAASPGAAGAVAPPAAEPAAPAPFALAPAAPVAAPETAVELEFFGLEEPGTLAALRPADQRFDAPDLNFQIIQYARLAVPQALAEQPFGVVYAPAWPTWLAAQELRHRSGQPLVLHIARLAAADDELIDLAAGWVAEIQRQALHRADLILTETPALAQRLRHELALPAHRVRAVPAADAAAVAQALRTAVRR